MKTHVCNSRKFSSQGSILIFIVLLIFIVTACSSGSSDNGAGGDGTPATVYQQGLSAYRSNDYSNAITIFQSLIAQYPTSIYVDNAQYYIARCYHKLGQFNDARIQYDVVIISYPDSNWVDNAKFYKAVTDVDEANSQTEPQAAYGLLDSGIAALSGFINDPNHAASSVLDDAQYNLGRAYHDQAELLQDFAAILTNTNTTVDQLFGTARSQYQILVNAGTSSWADDAQYQIAKTYYDQGKGEIDPAIANNHFATAIAEFDKMFDASDPNAAIYQTSNRLDSAYYFKGRSLQRQAELMAVDNNLGDFVQTYIDARSVFTMLLDNQFINTSPWADNAQYQIGASYYDEAGFELGQNTPDFALAQQKLSDAIGAYRALLGNAVLRMGNSADNAQYFLGRSLQRVVESIPAASRVAIFGGEDFTIVTYSTVRIELNKVISDFPQSSWVDNAYYEIGNTHFDEGSAAQTATDNASAQSAYNNALSSYNEILVSFAGISIWEDNAAYKMGLIFHNTGYCAKEKAAFDYALGLPGLSATATDDITNNHMDDLTAAVITDPPTATGNHACDTTNFPGINTSYFTGTISTVSLEQSMFTAGVNLYEAGQYSDAIVQFNQQLTSFANGDFVDNAHLYIGRSNYWLAGAAVPPQDTDLYSIAENEFILILNNYASGDSTDGAHYWLGKTYHATDQLQLARNQYEQVPQGSGWYDNALVQVAKTYYDESKTAAAPAAVLSVLLEAETRFVNMLNGTPTTSTSRDEAYYYLARTYHELAELLLANPELVQLDPNLPNVTLTAEQYFSLAHENYLSVTSASIYADNAAYYDAKRLYDQAEFLPPDLAMQTYDSAIALFDAFIVGFPNSSRVDGANYFKGRSYYKQAELVAADGNLSTNNFDWFYIQARDVFLGITALVPTSPTWHDDALYYLGRSYQDLSTPDNVSARNTYNLLLTDPVNGDSSWLDDARYQLGKMNYDEAVAAVDPLTKMQAYGDAVTEFNVFITQLNASAAAYLQSNRIDNVYYFKARSLDEQAQIILTNAASQTPDPQITGDVVQLQAEARAAYQSVLDTDAQSIYADNSAYRLGRSYYDYAQTLINPAEQLNVYISVSTVLDGFLQGGLYEASTYAYRGRYYLGRSRQEQGELQLADPAVLLAETQNTFDSARVAFQQTIDLDPAGIYSDNAQYQIGATYYDVAAQSMLLAQQADAQNNYALAQNHFSLAINAFDMVLNNPNFQNSNYADNAQYFKARSYHQVADIPAQYRVAVNNGIDFTATSYENAQTEYGLLITNYSQSNWVDNAYFERANTYYSQAQNLLDNAAIVSTYNNALDDYFWVVSNSQNIVENLKLDDESAFQMAMIYHATNYCNDEQAVFDYFVTLPYADTTSLSVANLHLDDIAVALANLPGGTVDHSCDNSAYPAINTYTLPNIVVSQELQLYLAGINYYSTGQYALAVPEFQNQLSAFPDGIYADDGHLYLGRSHYWLADYEAALGQFQIVLNIFSPGPLSDDAQYWLAKSYHARGGPGDFQLARTEYERVTQGSGWFDKAIFQFAKTYYDQSKSSAIPSETLSLLLAAEQQFNNAKSIIALTSSSRDNVIYYLGRTYHELAELLMDNAILAVNANVLSVSEYFALARVQYAQVATNSSYVDNAAYYAAKSHYDQAASLVPVDAMSSYSEAISLFGAFETDYPVSNNLDNALYFKGRSFYEQAQLIKADPSLVTPPSNADDYFLQARNPWLSIIAMTPQSTLWDDAQYFLGRSYHEQLNPDYFAARGAYQVLVVDGTSAWSDDAKYQMGKTYYEKAQSQIDPVLAIDAYNNAIAQFDVFITDPVAPVYQYPTSNRADAARYYKGRSLHKYAQLLVKNPSNANISGDVTQLFSDARTAYQSVILLDPATVYADNATYYLGKSHYDEANTLSQPDGQMSAFENAAVTLESFEPLVGQYGGSGYSHSALYFLGRSRQAQAELLLGDPTLAITDGAAATFVKARSAFQQAILSDGTGIYVDNAQYQIGATYYDEAKELATTANQEHANGNTVFAQTLFTGAQENLNEAILTFGQKFIAGNAPHFNSSFADNAQYYFGRSYHIAADIPLMYRISLLSSGVGTDFTQVGYVEARAGYLPLTVEPRYNGSTWIDNAYYQIGNTYFSQAVVEPTNLLKETAFNNALQNYNNVVTSFTNSIRFDNAVFQIAWIYHETQYCALESLWFEYHNTLNSVSPIDAGVRDDHLLDLGLPVPTSHLCPVVPVLTIVSLNPPVL